VTYKIDADPTHDQKCDHSRSRPYPYRQKCDHNGLREVDTHRASDGCAAKLTPRLESATLAFVERLRRPGEGLSAELRGARPS
jgi:hypothetical protein